MSLRHAFAAAALVAVGAPAFAYQVITPTLDERGYTQRWDPSVQGKTRAQVQSELAQARQQSPTAVRLGVYPTPRAAQPADRAQVQREGWRAARAADDPQYVQ